MAEAISVSSGIAGLLSLAITVAEKSYQYASTVRSASATIASYLRELSALKAVLFKLNELTEARDATARLEKTSTSLLLAMNIKDCQKELEVILRKLLKRSAGSALSALAWPFVEHDVKKQVDMLQRYNGLFHMALSADAYTIGSLTLKEVTALRFDNQEERSSSRQRAITDWLSPGPFDNTHTAVRLRRQENTGLWFLEEVASWLMRPGAESIFWCRGIPGAGKTILMSAVVDYIESGCCPSRIDGFAYIYFNYKQHSGQTMFSIIASIIVQLLGQSFATQTMVEKLFEKSQDGKKKAELEELVNVLYGITSSLTVVLAFDAFDEASQATRKDLMSLLSKSKPDNLLIFVTSRPDIDLRSVAKKTRLVDVVAQQSDLVTFVQARLESSEDVIEMLNDNADFIIQEIVRAVVAHAEGMFLLVAFQIEYICQQTSAKEMLLALQNLPSEAGSIYLQTLEQIDSQSSSQAQLARKVLCWLFLAKSSLTVPELLEALAIEAGSVALDPLNRRSAVMLVKVCRGLVVVDDSSMVIRLAHLTVHEFLANNLPELSQMRRELAAACLTYISFDAFKSGPCEGAQEFGHRLDQHPFYDYACTHYAEHLRDLNFNQHPLDIGKLRAFAISRELSESYLQMLFSYGIARLYDWYPQQTNPLHITASLGIGELADLLSDPYSNCINSQDGHNLTPLLRAIELGHDSVVEALLKHGADTEGTGESALNCAARNGKDGIVRLLLETSTAHGGQNLAAERDLLVAAIMGDLEAIKRLVCMGVNVDARDADGGNALQWAAWYGHALVVSCLLAAGSKIEADDKKGRRALHEAAERGHEDVVRLLLHNGADINARDGFGFRPIHRAAIAETPAVTRILLAEGVNVTDVTDHGDLPLHIAIDMGRVDTVRLLLETGVGVQDFRASAHYLGDATPQQREEIQKMLVEAQRLYGPAAAGPGVTVEDAAAPLLQGVLTAWPYNTAIMEEVPGSIS